jgi:hypothetical protein
LSTIVRSKSRPARISIAPAKGIVPGLTSLAVHNEENAIHPRIENEGSVRLVQDSTRAALRGGCSLDEAAFKLLARPLQQVRRIVKLHRGLLRRASPHVAETKLELKSVRAFRWQDAHA